MGADSAADAYVLPLVVLTDAVDCVRDPGVNSADQESIRHHEREDRDVGGPLKKHQRILAREKVQNVNLTQGFLAQRLGYKSIVIETAGETSNEALPSVNQA